MERATMFLITIVRDVGVGAHSDVIQYICS